MLETYFSASKTLEHATLTTEIYTRDDPTEKLGAVESIVPPHLQRGAFQLRQADRAPQLSFVMVSRIGDGGHKNAIKSPPAPHYWKCP